MATHLLQYELTKATTIAFMFAWGDSAGWQKRNQKRKFLMVQYIKKLKIYVENFSEFCSLENYVVINAPRPRVDYYAQIATS